MTKKERTAKEIEALPEAEALEALEQAVRDRSTALPEALAGSSRRALAKAAKKALYQLRSAGVSVAEKKAAPPPAAGGGPAQETLAALLTPLTGNGERGMILGRAVRGGIEALQVIFSDELGIMHLVDRETSRGTFRRLMREPKEGKAPPAIEVELDAAKELLAHAAAMNLASKTPYPPGTDEALRHFGVEPKQRTVAIPAPQDVDAGLAQEGAKLHDEPEIRAWLPPMESLRTLALKHEEIGTSQLYINEQQRNEQLGHQTRASAEAFFTPEVRKLYGARLWAMGEFFERSDRPHAAEIARAEARRMFHGAPGLSPFGIKLFEKVIELSRQAQRGEDLPKPEPAAPEAPVEKRSPGGLILPGR